VKKTLVLAEFIGFYKTSFGIWRFRKIIELFSDFMEEIQ